MLISELEPAFTATETSTVASTGDVLRLADCALEPDLGEASALPRVLLVENDAAMREVLVKMLSEHYVVGAVESGLDGCQIVRRQPPDLLLIDLSPPGTDNLTLIRAMRANPRTERVPIVMISSSMNKELLLRCLAAGASNFLLKPFGVHELIMCTRVELQLRGASAQLTH